MTNPRAWACAVALAFTATAAPAMADQPPAQGTKKAEKIEHKGDKKARAAPGPVAGLGLPVAVVAGGYVWFRNRKRKRNDQT